MTDPTRMFAGEGDAFRTNRRFKLVSEGMPAKRLSTAFDSVTLYGNEPDLHVVEGGDRDPRVADLAVDVGPQARPRA